MKLQGTDFGPVLGASGVQGFFGEGYPFHRYLAPIGLRFGGCTFVAKTTTLAPRKGNMPLCEDGITPLAFRPPCIVVNHRKGVVLNAVGLSGPGAKALLEKGFWQQRTKPFFISFAAVEKKLKDRLDELRQFVWLMRKYLPHFKAPVGLQLNVSCPNKDEENDAPGHFFDEIVWSLDIAGDLDIPLCPKLSVTAEVNGSLASVARHRHCSAIVISNTIPWGMFPSRINWQELFGSSTSPLAHLGGGGLSGKPLLPFVLEWVRKAREAGIEKPICAGGGWLRRRDADKLKVVGASAVSLGSMTILRPWRVQGAINRARRIYSSGIRS